MSKFFFTTVCKTQEEVDLKTLLEEFREGSIAARDQILQAHYQIIYNVARKFAQTSPSSDDIFAEALQHLVEAVMNAKTNLSHENITGYIVTSVKEKLRSAKVRHDFMFSMPGSTYSSKKKRGEKTDVAICKDIGLFPAIAKYENPSIEFLEILDLIAKDDLEKQIIELRKLSYSYEDIAKIVGKSPSRVGQIMQDLTDRFDKLY